VDSQVRSPDGRAHDVVFVGTTRGRVLKLVNTADPAVSLSSSPAPTLVEEIVVFRSDVPVETLAVVTNSMEAAPRLVAMTGDSVISLPLARCSAARSCSACVALRDPYCAWDVVVGTCAAIHTGEAGNKVPDAAAFLQNVLSGVHTSCPEEFNIADEPAHSSVMLDKQADTTESPIQMVNPWPVEDQYTAEELSLAVATSCVCALVVGFVTGFLMARRCSCSRTPENPYHVPYLNQ